MTEPEPPARCAGLCDFNIAAPLQIMDSCLRLYGHPELLSVAEQINGPDFTPFTESIIVKQPGLGASVACIRMAPRSGIGPIGMKGRMGLILWLSFSVVRRLMGCG